MELQSTFITMFILFFIFSLSFRYLATGDSFRTIASSFRVGVSTVCKVVPDVVTAIWDCLVEEFMAVPSTDEWRSIAEGFEERWNFPLCCGALDGKHVLIKAPPNTGSQFHNYKGTFSLVLLAVVDARYCFRVIDVRGYGRTSNGGTLANSAFGQALRGGTLHLPPDRPLPGADHRGPQPHVFVADEAFPLRKKPHEAIPWAHPSPRETGLQLSSLQSPAGGGECLWDPVLTVEDVSPPHRGSA